MHECLQVFKKVLDGRCRDAGGYAVIDMNRMLGNLTSVSSSPLNVSLD
jgi:hypothetical protein